MELMQASRQWASRPDDERFESLTDMLDHFRALRQESHATVTSSRGLEFRPIDTKALALDSREQYGMNIGHNAFSQLSALAGAPAGYLRKLPAPLVADCLNFGMRFARDIAEIGMLIHTKDDTGGFAPPQFNLRCATGPNYGRIWNDDIVSGLVDRFGDGISGDWRVPGIFGNRVTVDKRNTTLYAGDRDMFVFLADEDHRIEMPNRRDGQPGSLARGFFVWNSEVGDKTFGIGTFLFDYVCGNRIVWGAEQYKQITIRHTKGAPDRYIEELAPALKLYAESSVSGISEAIENARSKRIDDEIEDFLANRFNRNLAKAMIAVHAEEEHRPIETLWDATTAVTAYAKSIVNQDDRVAVEREGGKLLELAQ